MTQTVSEGDTALLAGTASDPDGNSLAIAWTQTGGPAVTLDFADGLTPSFAAPAVTRFGADVVLHLAVDDGYGGSASSDVTIHIANINHAPNARETLTFALTVRDPSNATASASVDVVVTNVDHEPTAIAGGNLTVNEASSVTLNGSASSDPDYDELTFAWTQVAGPAVDLYDANTDFPYFTAPFVSAVGTTLKFSLTVQDLYGGTSSDAVTVTAVNSNDPPTGTSARPSLGTLWAPDHSMVKVSILGIVDPNNNATLTITSVTQDEPTNGLGDGDTPIDAIINSDGTVFLRAERAGSGNGRVYHVHFTVSDFEGSSSGVVTVGVPKSKKTVAPIDGGELYDSTR